MPTAAPSVSPLDSARALLQQVFGYGDFRGLQAEVIGHVLNGQDALVLMPTGAGKSLCYQLPAIVRQRQGLGLTVVISPLIALMHDQVGAMEELGVAAAFLNSTLDAEATRRIEQQALAGELTLLYVAPERFVNPRFLGLLSTLDERGRLSLFAIDEAHCVSQWGHDFREDYLQLSLLHERYPSVPRLALTATADTHTRADMLERLQLQDARVFISSFDRPNIRYRVVEKKEPRAQFLRFLYDEHREDGRNGHRFDAGIVYCGSRKKVDDTAAWLQEQGIKALPYHAGLDAATRAQNQDRFLREDGIVMVATIAFGMGIDKPDVRFVAHLDLPKNIEGYYQETGRAGRDGEAANAWMAYGLADVVQQRRMIDESPAHEGFKQIQRQKLDALLALAESTDCRRVRLLNYFGEDTKPGYRCLNCDNCLQPPQVWDATEPARMALSCIYRFQKERNQRFGAGHLIDVLRGKETDKTRSHRHQDLSTWGIGKGVTDTQWRAVLRQLIALGALEVDGEYQTLSLGEGARAILRGEHAVRVREGTGEGRVRTAKKTSSEPLNLDAAAQARLEALRAWRSEVAREHDLPAYLIFPNTTLAELAARAPGSLDDVGRVSGVGAKKLEAYGREILRVLESVAN
ncbi:DNA helicase RecQ [Inhella gelatinilytica]|uniref:DNA helicase RecQ n=1 Tax=Inhella gelatinilytica TaxID=2795030 RepID=A0A931IXJ6_9BURK|nr:DNA helicase RecQ [Inhella gelatinilytica]MBH9551686.1 DNA helicase RecQ [Inhella gelatinilytica]